MYNISLSGGELSTLITTLEVEEYRIHQYYGALMQHGEAIISLYDKKRLDDIGDLIEKLKQVRGGH